MKRSKTYDIQVAIHNHGPGDVISRRRRASTTKLQIWTGGSASASISATRCVSGPTGWARSASTATACSTSTSRTSPPRLPRESEPRSAAESSTFRARARADRSQVQGRRGIRIQEQPDDPLAGSGRIGGLYAGRDCGDMTYSNTTVRFPSTSTRSSRCQRTAWASTRRSTSRPMQPCPPRRPGARRGPRPG